MALCIGGSSADIIKRNQIRQQRLKSRVEELLAGRPLVAWFAATNNLSPVFLG